MTDQNGAPPINDKELNGYLIGVLRGSPEELQGLEHILAAQRVNLSKARADAEQDELDARINAVVNGKNAEERKLQADAAVSSSAAVRVSRNIVAEIETTIAESEVDQKMLSRRFQSALALAELQSARLNLMSTAARKEPIK